MKKFNKQISRHFSPAPVHSAWKNIPETSWNSWVWQQQNRIKTLEQWNSILRLTEEEQSVFAAAAREFRVAVTPYYISLMHREDPHCPIRRQGLPQKEELIQLPFEMLDPAKEDTMSPVPGIVHRYPDRVLLYTTHHCAVYCRFCTRKRKVSDPESAMTSGHLGAAIDYIRNNAAIREVIVSGGDALSNSDERLCGILEQIRAIDHVQIIRIGSRNIVTLPQRITRDLASMLSEFSPIFFHTHFNHPRECTREAFEACNILASAGIPLNNHTVLLRGINDSVKTMTELNQLLLMMRVRPYYLYQCDQVRGNSGFRTSVDEGLKIIAGMRGWTSGLAIPHYVLDTPGGGKVPLLPNYVVSKDESSLRLRNYRDEEFDYRHQ